VVPNDSVHRHIATRIRSLAARRGWSGNHLADTAGVSRAQLSRLLTLQTSPTIGLLAKPAAAPDVNTRALLPRRGNALVICRGAAAQRREARILGGFNASFDRLRQVRSCRIPQGHAPRPRPRRAQDDRGYGWTIGLGVGLC